MMIRYTISGYNYRLMMMRERERPRDDELVKKAMIIVNDMHQAHEPCLLRRVACSRAIMLVRRCAAAGLEPTMDPICFMSLILNSQAKNQFGILFDDQFEPVEVFNNNKGH